MPKKVQKGRYSKFWTFVIYNSKSFTLVASTIVSVIAVLVICFILCYDVFSNGYVKTDLQDAGIFLLSVGGVLAGGSIGKVFEKSKAARFSRRLDGEETDEYDDSEEYVEPRVRRKKQRPSTETPEPTEPEAVEVVEEKHEIPMNEKAKAQEEEYEDRYAKYSAMIGEDFREEYDGN